MVKKLILSPLLRWVWKLSSQTQHEYNRGITAISIKTHSLSPSSLGLELSSQTQHEYNRGIARD
jgi:hypothetical protein